MPHNKVAYPGKKVKSLFCRYSQFVNSIDDEYVYRIVTRPKKAVIR